VDWIRALRAGNHFSFSYRSEGLANVYTPSY
jgi:hypothetical protein